MVPIPEFGFGFGEKFGFGFGENGCNVS